MGDLKALRSKDVTPEIVLQHVQKELPKIKEIYVVGLTDDGPLIWGTGNMSSICYAAAVMNKLVDDVIDGKVEIE